jgi:hypothetical protein
MASVLPIHYFASIIYSHSVVVSSKPLPIPPCCALSDGQTRDADLETPLLEFTKFPEQNRIIRLVPFLAANTRPYNKWVAVEKIANFSVKPIFMNNAGYEDIVWKCLEIYDRTV